MYTTRAAGIVTALLLCLCPAFAQSPWVPVTPGGACRDAVLDPDGGTVVVAVEDADEIWQIDPDSGGRVARFPVGDGPTSLAWTANPATPGGWVLGCAHAYDHSLTFAAKTAGGAGFTGCGGMPLDGGTAVWLCRYESDRFLAADRDGNRLLVVTPSDPASPSFNVLLDGADTPVCVAWSGNRVAWIGRQTAEVKILDLDHRDALPGKVEFPERPVSLCALPNGGFAAATASSVCVIGRGNKVEMPVTDMAKDGDGLVVLSGGDVVMLDGELNETGRVPLDLPARLVRACGPVLVAMAPQEKKAVLWNRAPKAPPAAQEAAGPAPSGKDVAIVEAQAASVAAAPASVPAPPEPAPAPPAPAAAAPQAAPAETAAAPAAAEPTQPSGNPAVAEAPGPAAEAPAEKPKGQYRSMPMFTGSLRAPQPGTATHKLIGGMERQSLRDALTRPIEFGEPGLGFTPPDWTEPLRDLEADSMTTDLATGKTVMKDNVRLRLGEMAFRSDQFSYSNEVGSYDADGHVLVTQHDSTLTADRLSYATPQDDVAEEDFVLEPRNDQDTARKRLSMGRITGQNLHVKEPTRELLAEQVDYDFAAQKGELVNARGRAAYFYYSAEKLHILGPEEFIAENAWFTTCPGDPPGYRLMVKELHVEQGQAVAGKGARLALGGFKTPFALPIWRNADSAYPWSLDFDTGRYAETGYYLNLGQQFQVSKELSLGPRIMPTEKQGVGLGGDVYYDYMEEPSSRLYRTAGELHGLQTTESRGYLAWYNRFEPNRDLVLRMQAEQWSDEEFYKDFFYDQYRHRGDPRTFANLTLRQEDYIATGTARINTHSWVSETERLPEATFHLVERPLADRLMFSFDTVNGYNDRNPGREYGVRSVNVARLSYDLDPAEWFSVTPFYELEGSYYQRERTSEDSATRVSNLAGVTLQTRLHREFPGFWGFSAFKHVVVPSVTYSYRPEPTLAAEDAPRFDALDNVYGRSRLEAKLSNVLYGRDAETNDVWQVARLNLYQGNDFWNETRKADDYEAELDLRPRPWWGMQLAGERHDTRKPESLADENYLATRFYKTYERVTGDVINERAADLNLRYADYTRLLSQLYYDNTVVGGRFNTRIGFAYSDTGGEVYNRDVLYGLGYRLSENWGVSFEHIYDLHLDELRSQTYEIRRSFKCWETALRFRDRQSGFDVNMEISLTAFPDASIGF